MTSTTNRVDWMAIVQELESGIDIVRSNKLYLPFNAMKPVVLREFFTIGFRGPRQLGKLVWLMRYTAEHPSVMIVFANDMRRDDFIRRASTGDLGISGMLEDFTPISAELLDHIAITAKELNTMIKEDKRYGSLPSRVIVDDAAIVFNNVRITKYYEWLAKQTEGHITSIMID